MSTIHRRSLLAGIALLLSAAALQTGISRAASAALSVADRELLGPSGQAVTLKIAEAPLIVHQFTLNSGSPQVDAGSSASVAPPPSFDASISYDGELPIFVFADGRPRTPLFKLVGLKIPIDSGLRLGGDIRFNQISKTDTSVTFGAARNTGLSPLAGQVTVMGRNRFSQGTLTVGAVQATGPIPFLQPALAATPATSSALSQPSTGDMDWSSLQRVMLAEAKAGNTAILVLLNASATAARTHGSTVLGIAQLCNVVNMICVLEPIEHAGIGAPGLSSSFAGDYFLSPDVHSAIYGQDSHVILSLRNGQGSNTIEQLRGAGLTHRVLVNAGTATESMEAAYNTELRRDPQRNVLLALTDEDQAQLGSSSSNSADVPILVVPMAATPMLPEVRISSVGGSSLRLPNAVFKVDQRGGMVTVRCQRRNVNSFKLFVKSRSKNIEITNLPSAGDELSFRVERSRRVGDLWVACEGRSNTKNPVAGLLVLAHIIQN